VTPRRIMTRAPVEMVEPPKFNPGDTATFMARQRDIAGETAWRELMIDNYRDMGAELVRVREKTEDYGHSLDFKVSWEQFKAYKESTDAYVTSRIGWQWAAIVAVAAAYGSILAFLAAKVFK
jgi:hypothetical protein